MAHSNSLPPAPDPERQLDAPEQTAHAAQDEDEPMLWCPVCNARLQPRKCKLICERCGYYMSCADYY